MEYQKYRNNQNNLFLNNSSNFYLLKKYYLEYSIVLKSKHSFFMESDKILKIELKRKLL